MTISEPQIADADPVIDALTSLVAPNCPILLNSEEGQAYASSLFAKLKALNRQANTTVREYKQETSEARALMDESLLKLQNLLYEKRHLEKEIEKCREYGCVHFSFYHVGFSYYSTWKLLRTPRIKVNLSRRRVAHSRRIYAASTGRCEGRPDTRK